MSPIIPSEPRGERAAYIAGLREFADWLEANPAAEVSTSQRLLVPLHTNPPVEEFAAKHGLTVVYDDEGNASCGIKFGNVEYYAYGYADFSETCNRVEERNARTWAERNGMTIEAAVTKGGAR